MRAIWMAALPVLACMAVSAQAGDIVVWDNFPGNSYALTPNYSAERNTLGGPSYVVDDANLVAEEGQQIRLLFIEWAALRQKFDAPKGYDKADFIVLDRNGSSFSEVASGQDQSWTLLQDNLGTMGAFTLYTGRIDFAQEILVEPGQYYFGARLVGNPANNFTGRNFMAGTSSGVKGAADGAFLYHPAAGIFDYTAASTIFGAPTDFSFRVGYEVIIPEPTSLALLAVGLLGVLRRR